MDKNLIKILLVEDDEDDYIITRAYISEMKTALFSLDWVSTYDAALDAMQNNRFTAYLVDYRLGPWNGLDLMREAMTKGCTGPIIILTGQGDHEVDIAAMEAGAADYMVKDQINAPLLERSIRYAIRHKQAEAALLASEEKIRAQYKGIPIPTFTFQRFENTFILADINASALEASKGELIHSLGKKLEDIEYGFLNNVMEDVTRCLLKKRIIRKETEFQNRETGGKRVVDVNYAFVPPDLVLMHAEDITDQKLADELLRLQRELAIALSSTSDLTEALNHILDTACQIPGFDSGILSLVDRNTSELNLAVHRGLSPQFVEKNLHYNAEEPLARLVQKGEPKYVLFSQLLPEAQDDVQLNEGLHVIAELPITYEDHVIAELFLASHTMDEMPASIRNALQGMTAQIGEALARLRAEESLHESQKNFQSLFDTVDDFLFILDVNGYILRCNPVAQKRLGYSIQELTGKPIFDLHPADLRLEAKEKLSDVLTGKKSGWTTVLVTTDGSQIPVDSRFARFTWDNQEAVSCISRDITERQKMEEKLSHQATHDSLTGLPNRYLFGERLQKALSQDDGKSSRIGVAFFNLDRFKDINESLGHPVGDQLLVKVAQRLSKLMQPQDTLARMGNDEFVFIINNRQDGSEIFEQMLRYRTAFEKPFQVEERELYMTVSIGVSIYPTDAQDATTLLRNANTALDFAKMGGKNSARWFEPTMQARTLERLELTNRLRRGIEQKEFVLYYQPLVNIATNTVVGMEALVRWKHPDLGMILPGNFIPLAEESGLIKPLGEWVLIEACRQMVAWREQGLPRLRVSVNISPVQFEQRNWLEGIAQSLTTMGVEPAQLTIEVTENVFLNNIEEVAQSLQALREIGVKVHIDDFGTDYSSLAYLRKLPVDSLKIAQTFINSLTLNPEKRQTQSLGSIQPARPEVDHIAMVNAIIALGHSLKLQVIAEGVETKEQLAILNKLGCDEAQGYLFAHPMPADQVWDMILGINKNNYTLPKLTELKD